MSRPPAIPKPGIVHRIALEDGRFGFAKRLNFPEVAFLDLRLSDPAPDLAFIAAAPTAFRINVAKPALIGRTAWPRLGALPLAPDEEVKNAYHMRDRLKPGTYRLYQNGTISSATYEDCKDLESAAVWSRSHAEDRLNAHFARRSCIWTESLRPLPPV